MKCRGFIVAVVVLSLISMGYPLSAQQPGGKQTPRATSQKGNRRTDETRQTPSTKRRILPKPQDPEAVALLVHLLDRYARNLSDKTDFDRSIEQELSKRPGSREAAKRMVANFERVPLAERQNALGKWASLTSNTNISASQYRAAFERLARSVKKTRAVARVDKHVAPTRVSRSGKHHKSEGTEPDATDAPARTSPQKKTMALFRGSDYRPGANGESPPMLRTVSSLANYPHGQRNRFAMRYEGMWCHSETDDDHLSASDEVYAITTVTDSRGHDWTTRHPQPRSPEWYEDLDDGDFRVGPRRRCWGGAEGLAAEDLTLTVAVFEHDDGDPKEVERLFLEGLALLQVLCAAALFTGGPIAGLACELIGLAFVGLITGATAIFTGGEDDPLSIEAVTITADQIRDWGGEPPASSRRGNIPYHFRTIHTGRGNAAGADYHLYFSIVRTDG